MTQKNKYLQFLKFVWIQHMYWPNVKGLIS
jgi:hypothetical protein